MRVLLLIDRLYRGGGTETYVLTLARGLRRLGHDVTIYTSGGPWVAQALRRGLVVVSQTSMLSLGQREVTRFADFLRKHSFDVVHAHETVGFTLYRRAMRLSPKCPPLVFTLHSPYIGNRTLRHVCSTAKAIIAVSDPLRKQLKRDGHAPSRKLTTIPNGVDMETFRPTLKARARKAFGIPHRRFVIGYAARFTTDKISFGERVAHTLKQYAHQDANVQVLIAGRGSLKYVKPAHRVKVLDHVDKMDSFYNACDVVIGTARVALETLASGTPTIVVGTGGYHGLVTIENVRRMIAHNFGDHAVPRRDWTEYQLLARVKWVKRHANLVLKDTRQVRTYIRHRLSTRQMVEQVARVYQSVVRKRR